MKRTWPVPSDLGPHGSKYWTRTARLLFKSGSLHELDRETFHTLCSVYDRMVAADLEMRRDGVAVESGIRKGVLKKHPAYSIWKTSMDTYIKLLAHFGLSPLSRGEKVTPKQEEDSNGKTRFFK